MPVALNEDKLSYVIQQNSLGFDGIAAPLSSTFIKKFHHTIKRCLVQEFSNHPCLVLLVRAIMNMDIHV